MRAAAKYERVYRDFLQEMREECPGIRYAYIFYRPLPFQLRKGHAIILPQLQQGQAIIMECHGIHDAQAC